MLLLYWNGLALILVARGYKPFSIRSEPESEGESTMTVRRDGCGLFDVATEGCVICRQRMRGVELGQAVTGRPDEATAHRAERAIGPQRRTNVPAGAKVPASDLRAAEKRWPAQPGLAPAGRSARFGSFFSLGSEATRPA